MTLSRRARRAARRDLRHVGLVAVAKARPEEPPQSVLAIARHHVHVEMRHALAHPVVHRDERARRAQAALDGPAEALHLGEERLEQLTREIDQRLVVLAGDDEGVADRRRGDRSRKAKVCSVLEHDHHLGCAPRRHRRTHNRALPWPPILRRSGPFGTVRGGAFGPGQVRLRGPTACVHFRFRP